MSYHDLSEPKEKTEKELLREQFSRTRRSVGAFLWVCVVPIIMNYIFPILPLVILPWPWWVCVIVLAAIVILPDFWGGLLTIGIWVWALVVAVQQPFSFLSLLVYVAFLLWLVRWIALVAGKREY